MKKYLIALGSLLLMAVVSNAQTTAPKKSTTPVKKETAPVANKPAKTATSANTATQTTPSKKATTPSSAIKRKHHYKKNTDAMKPKAG